MSRKESAYPFSILSGENFAPSCSCFSSLHPDKASRCVALLRECQILTAGGKHRVSAERREGYVPVKP